MSRPVAEEPVLTSQWLDFVKFCNELRFGRIEKLEIQNGVPVFAESVTTKVKFT